MPNENEIISPNKENLITQDSVCILTRHVWRSGGHHAGRRGRRLHWLTLWRVSAWGVLTSHRRRRSWHGRRRWKGKQTILTTYNTTQLYLSWFHANSLFIRTEKQNLSVTKRIKSALTLLKYHLSWNITYVAYPRVGMVAFLEEAWVVEASPSRADPSLRVEVLEEAATDLKSTNYTCWNKWGSSFLWPHTFTVNFF